jgi:hypothetical protein
MTETEATNQDGQTITVYNDPEWLGRDVAAGERVYIIYDPPEAKWVIVSADED